MPHDAWQSTSSVSTQNIYDAEREARLMKRAKEILSTLSLDEKIGQLFIVRCPRENAAADAAAYHLGGYTLYAVDFENSTPDELRARLSDYNSAARLPMFFAVDEEGGDVVRASKFKSFRQAPFESPQAVYRKNGLNGLKHDTAEKCSFLKALGINLNYAPVCDLTCDPNNYIYSRTLGVPAEEAAEGIRTIVGEMNAQAFGCSLKHFPGYGDNVDTHTGMARDTVRTVQDFERSDFLPFKAGIEAGAGMVMVAHIIIDCMDSTLPASLSSSVHELLRKKLGFEGVIVTDSLDMDAITQFTGGSEASVSALLAGNDLLCCSSYREQIPAVKAAVSSGIITKERINESVLRILMLKLKLNIIN